MPINRQAIEDELNIDGGKYVLACFKIWELSQHENGDLRKIKVCVNLRKVGHPTLRKLSTARKGL